MKVARRFSGWALHSASDGAITARRQGALSGHPERSSNERSVEIMEPLPVRRSAAPASSLFVDRGGNASASPGHEGTSSGTVELAQFVERVHARTRRDARVAHAQTNGPDVERDEHGVTVARVLDVRAEVLADLASVSHRKSVPNAAVRAKFVGDRGAPRHIDAPIEAAQPHTSGVAHTPATTSARPAGWTTRTRGDNLE
jgi:hypothetical protein